MTRDNAVFFPLRSSAGWFRSPETVKQFEAQLKAAVFCFDSVVLENGNYQVDITENGAIEYPPMFGREHRRLHFNEGGEVSFRIRALESGEDHDLSTDIDPDEYIPIISGKALVAYHVDFYPVLHPAGVLSEPCFKWVNRPLDEEQVKQIREAVQEEEGQDKEFWEQLPFLDLEKGYIARSYYHDTIRMAMLGLPTLFDARVSEFTRRKGQQLVEFAPDVMPRVYHMSLVNRMPDIGALPWDEVIDKRDTPAAQEFRNMIARVRQKVLEELPNLGSQADVQLLTGDLFSQELVDETMQYFPKRRDVGMSAMLNLAPIAGGVVGTVMEAAKYVESRQSWLALFPPREQD